MPMERFELRIDEELLTRVDAWAAEQRDRPVRAEAVRRLLEQGIAASSTRAVRFSDGEKALLLMMKDLYAHLKVDGEMDPRFLADVIHGGHYWAPKWELSGLFHDHVDNPAELSHVLDVLDTWSFIEEAYDKLGPADRKKLEERVGERAKHVRFTGFDGNNEASQGSIARFLIEKMDRFSRFKGRELNSHYPTFTRYSRMAAAFEKIRPTLVGQGLSLDQLAALLKD